MKISRNAPCPCGSGKKYKKCCLPRKVVTSEQLDYRRLSDVYNKVFEKLIDYARRVFGPASLEMSLAEFWMWPDEDEWEPTEELFGRHSPLFLPWFIFNWNYDPAAEEVELDIPHFKTVAELYLETQSLRADTLERKLIEAVNRKPYTFYEALEVEAGWQIVLQDILSGRKITVQERTGSHHLKPSDIVFGRATVVEGIGMIMGLATSIIPPGHKPAIIGLRSEMKEEYPTITEEVLGDWDMEIRELYLEIDRAMFSMPKLCNTDGHPMEFHKIVYAIDSPETAFEKLVSLCVTRKASELRKQAERDAGGHIRHAEITWDRNGHKAEPGLSNTVLGRIMIDDDRLTAEVNSAERAKAIRKKIEARLGSEARFKLEKIRSLDSMMSDEQLSQRAAKFAAEQDALMHDPEVRRMLAEVSRKHWEGWVDMPLPALGGRTPREAVREDDGAEAVEALLRDAERHGENNPDMGEMNREGIRLVRELLGLTKPVF